MSSPGIKKPGLVSKSYRMMSRLGLGCKMAGGYITTAWENKDIKTTLNGKTVEIFLGIKPSKLSQGEHHPSGPGVYIWTLVSDAKMTVVF